MRQRRPDDIYLGDDDNRRLIQILINHGADAIDASELDRWLTVRATERRMYLYVNSTREDQPRDVPYRDCRTLERCASEIVAKLDFLGQLSDLEVQLSRAYLDLDIDGPATTKPIDWSSFRSSLYDHAVMLEKVSRRAREDMEKTPARRGRPSDSWRNACFCELVQIVGHVWDSPREACIRLAQEVWNLYFEYDHIVQEETAQKIIQRERQRRTVKGHNHV